MHRSTRRDAVPLIDKLVLTPEDVSALSGFGRGTIYAAMRSGALIARKEGSRTVILREDMDAWLRNLPKRPVAANDNAAT